MLKKYKFSKLFLKGQEGHGYARPANKSLGRGVWEGVGGGNSRLKTAHFGRIQAMSLPGRFKLDDSASNELVGVKFYDFFLDQKKFKKQSILVGFRRCRYQGASN